MLFDVDEKCNMLLSRPLPPLPDMEISEDAVVIVADVLRLWINRILVVAKEIAVNRNLKLFLQVRYYSLPKDLSSSELDKSMLLLIFVFVCLFISSDFGVWKVAVVLWIASYVGNLFSFLTLVYIGKLVTPVMFMTP